MQAAPLQSSPSTGLQHYSAASKHVSDGWDESDSRVLEWAETCSPGTYEHMDGVHIVNLVHVLIIGLLPAAKL